jgi:hypothetical protein
MCICYHWHNAIRIVICVSVHCVSDDRYMYYYSDGIVSVITDAHITILMALAFCQWWQIHILLFWWHWHCVSETDTHIRIVICVSVITEKCQYHQNSNMCICHHWHNANVIRIVICVYLSTYYYSEGIGIVSMITDTLITNLTDTYSQRN